HHAEDLEVLAAVAAAGAAGAAFLAVEVGLHRAALAGLHVRDAGAGLEHLDAQLVAGDARIGVEGHLAQEAGDVGAADAHAQHAHQRLARGGLGRLVDLDLGVVPGLFEADRLHDFTPAAAGFLAPRILSPFTWRPRCFWRPFV